MLDFARFQVLTFDCYGTLIDWETGIFSALRPILAARGKSIADTELLKVYSELESEAERGEFRSYRQVLESVAAFPRHGSGAAEAQDALPTRSHFQCG